MKNRVGGQMLQLPGALGGTALRLVLQHLPEVPVPTCCSVTCPDCLPSLFFHFPPPLRLPQITLQVNSMPSNPSSGLLLGTPAQNRGAAAGGLCVAERPGEPCSKGTPVSEARRLVWVRSSSGEVPGHPRSPSRWEAGPAAVQGSVQCRVRAWGSVCAGDRGCGCGLSS